MDMQTTSPKSEASWKIAIARHVVGITLLLLAQSPATYRSWGFLTAWLGGALFVFAAAGIFTGLALLFFTKRQSGKTQQTFTIAAWVIAAMLLAGQWLPGTSSSPEAAQSIDLNSPTVINAEFCHSQGKLFAADVFGSGPACIEDASKRPCTSSQLAELKEASVSKAVCTKRGDTWSEQMRLCYKKSSFFLPACQQ